MNSKITVLDCTLRDGGYYNKWDFNIDQAKKLLSALNKAGVDIIEVGYKSKYNKDEYFGLFKYCNEAYLDFLSKSDAADYAFMIDIKEFLNGDTLDYLALDAVIKPSGDSIFSWVRLASHHATINFIIGFTNYFREKGYKVGYNLMGGSLLSNQQILEGLNVATESKVDVFYIADSFGSFYPEDTRKLIRFIKSNYKGIIGIHTHDNQGLAYANTMVAIEEGVEFIDGTVTGMGRGAGNLHTEQFLLGYSKKMNINSYRASSLMPIIADYVEPLKQHYKWGYNLTYMYSGLLNVHPTYCQNLATGNQFTPEEQAIILGDIPEEFRAKYSKEVLEKAKKNLLKEEINNELSDNIELFDLRRLKENSCIVYARGAEGVNNLSAIKKLIQKGIPLIECNPTGSFTEKEDRFVVILNRVRLKEWMNKENDVTKAQVVLGVSDNIDKNLNNVSFYPFKIGDFDVSQKILFIPDFDAGLYAIALAIKAGMKNIYLAGFDGYDSEELNKSKDKLFTQIANNLSDDINIQFITPTKYNSFKRGSIYTL